MESFEDAGRERERLMTLSKDELVELLLKTKGYNNDDSLVQQQRPLKKLKSDADEKACNDSEKKESKSTSSEPKDAKESKKNNKKSNAKNFSFDNFAVRHIALRVAYLGENYVGFASQKHTTNTVESRLFEALLESRLLDPGNSQTAQDFLINRKPIASVSEFASKCNYSRCGRTDKGVSAFGQVVALHLRSNLTTPDAGIVSLPLQSSKEGRKPNPNAKELNYSQILNGCLPDDIRVVGWAPVALNFNARFNCLYRTYKYYFLGLNLNIEKMIEAAQYFIGDHDFRNFCKIDAVNVINFKRTIISFDISPTSDFKSANSKINVPIYEATICGYAFLWHQIRCIMAVLFLVGQGHEKPSIVHELLDVKTNSRKPLYELASELPLVLYDCGFEGVTFQHEREALQRLYEKLEQQFHTGLMRSVLPLGMLQGLRHLTLQNPNKPNELTPSEVEISNLLQGMSYNYNTTKRKYTPLLKRPKDISLEDKVAQMCDRKRKIYIHKFTSRGEGLLSPDDENDDSDTEMGYDGE